MGCTAIRRMSRAFVTRYWTSRSRPLVAMRPCLCSGHARHSSHICSASREARPTHDLPFIPSLPRRRQILPLLLADGGGDVYGQLEGSFIRPVQAAVILCLSTPTAMKTTGASTSPWALALKELLPPSLAEPYARRTDFPWNGKPNLIALRPQRNRGCHGFGHTLAAYFWAWLSRHLPF